MRVSLRCTFAVIVSTVGIVLSPAVGLAFADPVVETTTPVPLPPPAVPSAPQNQGPPVVDSPPVVVMPPQGGEPPVNQAPPQQPANVLPPVVMPAPPQVPQPPQMPVPEQQIPVPQPMPQPPLQETSEAPLPVPVPGPSPEIAPNSRGPQGPSQPQNPQGPQNPVPQQPELQGPPTGNQGHPDNGPGPQVPDNDQLPNGDHQSNPGQQPGQQWPGGNQPGNDNQNPGHQPPGSNVPPGNHDNPGWPSENQPGNGDDNHHPGSGGLPDNGGYPGQPGNYPGDDHHDGPGNLPSPVPLPQPPNGHGFPDWGHNPPQEAHPWPVDPHDPHGDWDDHNGPRPPIPGWDHVDNPWQHGDQHLPPPYPDVHVGPGNGDQVTIINNVTQINNTNIDNSITNIYLTNFNTHQILNFPAAYGTPYILPQGWCGGIGGSWGFSANVGIPGFGASFAGGGAFNVNGGCGYIPPPPIIQPLIIYGNGYQPYYTNDYFVPQGCGCVYAGNTYLYGQNQQVVVQGQEQTVFVPTSYTPDVVFQQPVAGLPPFITGENPTTTMASLSELPSRQYPLIWGGLGVVVVAILIGVYVNRRKVFGLT